MKQRFLRGVTILLCAQAGMANAQKLFLSSDIVEEVMSEASSPYAYDWRSMMFELEVGYDYVDEANNFDTDGVHIMVGVPVSHDIVARFGIRRYWVYGTKSSDLIGQTPFRQAGRGNRYEVVGEADYVLFQGRMVSPLSPLVSDSEHVLYATGGLHLAHENAGNMPARNDKPEALSGQKKVHSGMVLEVGARWHIYFPNALGAYFLVQRQIPRGNTAELRHWTHFGMGLSWAFGSN